jgi:hypothetical protein
MNFPLKTRGRMVTAATLTIQDASESQLVFDANVARRYLIIVNRDDEDTLYVNFGDDASGGNESIPVGPGQNLTYEGVYCPQEAVNIWSATDSHPFTAKEGM